MYKKTVRGMSLFFAMLMIMSTSAFASDMRASSRIDRYSARIMTDEDGNLWIYFSVNASSIMDDIGSNKIAIQRNNGTRWVTENTITPADVPQMQTSDAIRHSATISYKPEYPSYMYRAVVSVYARDSLGTSSASVIAE